MNNSTPQKKNKNQRSMAVWQWGRGSVAVGACHAPAARLPRSAAHAPTATLQHSTATPRCHTPTATQPRSTATLHCHAPATLPRPNYHTATLHCHAPLPRSTATPRCRTATPQLPHWHAPTATLRWFFGFGCCVVFGVDFLILNCCVFVLVLIFWNFLHCFVSRKKEKQQTKNRWEKDKAKNKQE